MKSLIRKKNGSVIDFSVNAKELTTEELKTKVNGGSALTPEQQAKMAEMTRNGDFSYLNELTGNNKEEEKPAEVVVTGNPGNENKKGNEGNSTSSTENYSEKEKESKSENRSELKNGNEKTGDYTPQIPTSPFVMEKDDDQTFEMEVDYKKNDTMKMGVTIRTKNKDGTYDYSNGKVRTIYFDNVTNNVKKPGDRSGPVSFRDYNYYPVQFPDGVWNITETISDVDSKIYGPCAIRTDASIYLDKYNKDGTEILGTVLDSGYLIHTGESATTWGCLKMGNDKDLTTFFDITNNVLSSGGSAKIRVSSL